MEWLFVVAAIVFGVPAVAWLAQERMIFYPQPLATAPALPAHARPLDVVAADGTRLAGYFVAAPVAPAPLVVYFGGNAEEISWTIVAGKWPRDWSIAGLNYRGYGTSEGTPGERELHDDALALFDALAARADVDPRRVVVVGRSLGTGVAARVAAERPVAGAVLISPYDSLAAVGRTHYPWLPVDLLLRHRFEASRAAAAARAPLLAIVAQRDTIIPPERSRALYDAWTGPKRWVDVADAGHNDLGATRAMWDAIDAFLRDVALRT